MHTTAQVTHEQVWCTTCIHVISLHMTININLEVNKFLSTSIRIIRMYVDLNSSRGGCVVMMEGVLRG